MSLRSLNNALISLFSSEKSMRTYERYSLRANSSANVDFPTRLAPSMSIAVRPLDLSFHSFRAEYAFLSNNGALSEEAPVIIPFINNFRVHCTLKRAYF